MQAPDLPLPIQPLSNSKSPTGNGGGYCRVAACAIVSAIVFAIIWSSNPTRGQTPPKTEPAPPTVRDATLEKRVLLIAEELRCLVCQNQTIADSNADLAIDLRKQIREQVGAGRSDGEIMEFMVQRYGDFVRYRPPVRFSTAMLWFGPLLLLVAGAAVIFRVAQGRRRMTARKLTEAEERRAQGLLDGSASAAETVAPELPGHS